MKEVIIAGAVRTAMGKFLGGLSSFTGPEVWSKMSTGRPVIPVLRATMSAKVMLPMKFS